MESAPRLSANLPTRITGIVFWGMVLVGLLIALITLSGREHALRQQNQRDVRYLEREVAQLLDAQSESGPRLRTRLDALMRARQAELGFEAATLSLPHSQYQFGSLRPGQEALTLADTRHAPVARLTVHFPGTSEIMTQQRKRVLIGIGLLVIVFGLVLKLILHRLLSCPFNAMIDTARRFNQGETGSRFNTAGSDEFAFLSSFINQALDQQSRQQEQLASALARATASEAALFNEKERLDVTLHSITDAVITTDAHGIVQYLNPAAERLIGLRRPQALGHPIAGLIRLQGDHDHQPVSDPLSRCLASMRKETVPVAASLVCADGIAVAVEASAAPMLDRLGALIGAVMICQDVSHARLLTTQLTYQACHDALTSLVNRREFEHRLGVAIENARLNRTQHILMYLDLDRFKIVNDTCGHHAGDRLLMQLATLLGQHVRASDTLARLGGDEFGVLLEGCDLERGLQIGNTLLQAVSEFRFFWQDKLFQVGVSIGMVRIDIDASNLPSILSAADAACYSAKRNGRNRIEVFTGDDGSEHTFGEFQWIARIHSALANERMRLYWQRIASTDATRPRRAHAEILLRMLDEDGTPIPPMAFIPTAERYNIMPLVDRWVVRQTLDWIARRHAVGHAIDEVDRYAINLSAQSLGDPQFLPFIQSCLTGSGVPTDKVCFEITETAAIAHIGHARVLIKALREMGCSFALDDFGSGMSSYSYLKNLGVDYVKIDGAFVRDILSDPIDREMVDSIHRIGRVMGIETIAECVENEDVFNKLAEIGVNHVQGYWIHRPEPLPDFDPHPENLA